MRRVNECVRKNIHSKEDIKRHVVGSGGEQESRMSCGDIKMAS